MKSITSFRSTKLKFKEYFLTFQVQYVWLDNRLMLKCNLLDNLLCKVCFLLMQVKKGLAFEWKISPILNMLSYEFVWSQTTEMYLMLLHFSDWEGDFVLVWGHLSWRLFSLLLAASDVPGWLVRRHTFHEMSQSPTIGCSVYSVVGMEWLSGLTTVALFTRWLTSPRRVVGDDRADRRRRYT